MSKTVLVTGSAGFLGSHLVDSLLFEGYNVVGIDNFFRGRRDNISKNPNLKFYEVDLTIEDSKLKKIIQRHSPDVVFHYAAINGTKYFYDMPLKVFNDNINMTKNVLNSLRNSSVKKVFYASSSEVYGDPLVVPTPEDHAISLNAFADRDSYAASKAFGDFYVKLFSEEEGLDFVILRIFNTYGPRMDNSEYGQVVPEFLRKAMENKEFMIIGDGSETRSFCYVRNHVEMVIKILDSESNGIFNVGNDDEITILDLAKRVHKILGKEFKPKFSPPRDNDHSRRCPDIQKIKLISDINFLSLEEGLFKTLKAIKGNKK